MATTEDIQLLISRGLDADLNREEMRQLYRLAVNDAAVRTEMGELADLETGLVQWSAGFEKVPFPVRFAAGAKPSLRQNRLLPRFWQWLRSPQGLAMQPLSFAGGLAAALLAVWLVPVSGKTTVSPDVSRLQIHAVQFTHAEARLDWTNRFFVVPGAATRLAVSEGGNQPVHLQFESVEPVPMEVNHLSTSGSGEVVQPFTVDGVGFASLLQPRRGDEVIIRNRGQVPVVVYLRGVHGTTVTADL